MENIASLKATVRKLQLDLYHKDLSLEETKQNMRAELANEVNKELNVLLLEKDDEISRLNQHITMQDARMRRMQSGNVVVEKTGTDEDKETIRSLLEENQRLQEQFEEVSDRLMAINSRNEISTDVDVLQNFKQEMDRERSEWQVKEASYKEEIDKLEVELDGIKGQVDKLTKDLEEALKKPKRKSAKQLELEKEVETMREEFMIVLAEKESEIDDLKERLVTVKNDFETQNKIHLETIHDLEVSLAQGKQKQEQKMNELRDLKNAYDQNIIEKETELVKLQDKLSFFEDLETKNASLTTRLMEREKSSSRYVKHLEQSLEQLRKEIIEYKEKSLDTL